MFEQFLYFIIVLLIITTYHVPETASFSGPETLGLFVVSTVVYAVAMQRMFRRWEHQIGRMPMALLDHGYHARMTRAGIAAIVWFAADIYILNLPVFTGRIAIFARFPTLETLLYLLLFLGFMTISWIRAYPVYRVLAGHDSGCFDFVRSQISFSVPVYLPWLMLSGISDLLLALPFEQPAKWLRTPEGEITYFVIFLFAAAVVAPAVIQWFWRCTPLEPGAMRDRIEELFRRAGLSYRDILYWPIFGGRMITAGIMGLVSRFRYLLVTQSLLWSLDREEIEAVVAHEIGHVRHKHLLFYLFFFGGYLVVSYTLFDLILYGVLYFRPLLEAVSWGKIDPTSLISIGLTAGTILLFLVYFRYGFGYFMRNFERQADTFVYTLFPSSFPLIRTLEKIGLAGAQPMDKPNWHHFSIAQRIDFLKQCEQDRTWITRHDRKVRLSLLAYAGVILVVGWVGILLNFGEAGRSLDRRFLETIVRRELEKNPENMELQTFLGDLYFQKKQYSLARSAYQRALEIHPDNPAALNNLAWLLVTAEEPSFQDPETAVYLAEKAVSLQPSAPLLDTLAESYFASGRADDAVDAARLALEAAVRDIPYFERQLERFSQAAGNGKNR